MNDEHVVDQQLRDITLIIGEIEINDEGQPYAVTRIYRADLVGSVEDFIKHVRSTDQVVEFHNPYVKETRDE